MPTWQVIGWREGVEPRVLLETDSMARAAAHLARLQKKFLGLTAYKIVPKETPAPPEKEAP